MGDAVDAATRDAPAPTVRNEEGLLDEEIRKQAPTPSELEILNVLWRRGPSTVREVNDVLRERRTSDNERGHRHAKKQSCAQLRRDQVVAPEV